MTQSRLALRCLVVAAVALSSAGNVLAAQGPGVETGTANHLTQLGMAIAVYGTSALLIIAGLIGAVRRR